MYSVPSNDMQKKPFLSFDSDVWVFDCKSGKHMTLYLQFNMSPTFWFTKMFTKTLHRRFSIPFKHLSKHSNPVPGIKHLISRELPTIIKQKRTTSTAGLKENLISTTN